MVVAELLTELRARGVTLTVQGSQLLTTAPKGAITPDLGEAIKAHRAALLVALQGQVSGAALAPRPDPLEVGQQPGHCGTCARWEALAPPLAHMGLCSAGRAAHGWYDGNPVAPVEIQAGHGCAAHGGKGWQVKTKCCVRTTNAQNATLRSRP